MEITLDKRNTGDYNPYFGHVVAPPVAAPGSETVAYQKAMAASRAKMVAWKILCLKQSVNL